jgi:hypothetical protein
VLARELYDHDNDPQEKRNVVASPRRKRALKDVSALLEKTFPRQGYGKK